MEIKEKGFCICMHCNTRVLHQKMRPCREESCPQCGRAMLKEGSYHHQLYILKKGEQENENSSTN